MTHFKTKFEQDQFNIKDFMAQKCYFCLQEEYSRPK